MRRTFLYLCPAPPQSSSPVPSPYGGVIWGQTNLNSNLNSVTFLLYDLNAELWDQHPDSRLSRWKNYTGTITEKSWPCLIKKIKLTIMSSSYAHINTICIFFNWKRPWCWERLRAGGEGDDKGWDGWMASPTQWIWVWVGSRSWCWTGRSGVLWVMGS